MGISNRPISECCHGRRSTAAGFKWRFLQVSKHKEEGDFYFPEYLLSVIGNSLERAHQQYYDKYGSSSKEGGPKPVEQVDTKTGAVIAVFNSGAEAARAFQLSSNAISACCNGKRVSAAGYSWRFAKIKDQPEELIDYDFLNICGPNGSKPVEQVEISTGEVIMKYSSGVEAARTMGLKSNAISACCTGRTYSAGGYFWRFWQPPKNESPSPQTTTTTRQPQHSTEFELSGNEADTKEFDETVQGSEKKIFRTSISSINRRGAKPVEQIHMTTGEVVRIFPTGAEAARSIGLHNNAISNCCLGKRLSAGGYYWRFKKPEGDSIKHEIPSNIGRPPGMMGERPNLVPRYYPQPNTGIQHALIAGISQEGSFEFLDDFEFRTAEQRPVEQLDYDTGVMIDSFPSCMEASKVVSINAKSILDCCVGRTGEAAGYRWRFLETDLSNSHPTQTMPPSVCPEPPSQEQSEKNERKGEISQTIIEEHVISELSENDESDQRTNEDNEPFGDNDSPRKRSLESKSETTRMCTRSLAGPLVSPEFLSPKSTGGGPKPVEQIDIRTGEIIDTYHSGAHAARSIGVSSYAISACCHGKRTEAGGFLWRFAQSSDAEGVATSLESGDANQTIDGNNHGEEC
jgi:plasmid maintenance system antidote protein VapI